ncbi:aminotransferase class IV family protein [Streptomyces sp. NPDC000075]|uniref:aminotransferase class IV family protein n=1 Tax=Streptomyces TaxID=1883 RepID=UPI0031CE6985
MAELNGTPVTLEDLQALALTNYGHFTFIRLQDGAARGLSLHLDRLVRDCSTVFGVDLDRERTLTYIRKAVRGVSGAVGVRVTIFDPALDMGRPSQGQDPHVLVNLRPVGAGLPSPLTTRSFTFSRDNATVKHLGLQPQLRIRRDAQLAGFDDALFTEPDGRISEGTTWNPGFVTDDGTVIWPEAPALSGTTMLLLRSVDAPKQTTAPVRLTDLPNMAAAFATSTTLGVRPISAIDDLRFPNEHPVLTALHEAYTAIPPERL